MKTTFRPAKAALAFALATAALGAQALPARIAQSPEEALTLLTAATGGALTKSQRELDAYTAVQARGAKVLLADDATQTPVLRAKNFLSTYGVLPGVTDAINQLSLARVSKDFAGSTHVHLNQMQNGLAVFGGRMVVHMNGAGITGLSGVFVPGLESISATPAKEITYLRERGLVAARKLHPAVRNLAIESTRLMYYRTGLLKGVSNQGNFLAYEVMVKGGSEAFPVRERIILNANSGNVLNRINEIHTVLNREIYTPGQTTPDPAGLGASIPVPPTLTEGSPLAPADEALMLDDRTATSSRAPLVAPTLPALANLYFFAGGTYNLYKNLFGREGYNDGAVPGTEQVQKSVYLVNDQCPNAYWNGDSTNYCPAFDGDDVVSHEWSHAYTEYTHGLIYQYQSGALNESYSDIFGEVYDLVNGREGPLGATLTEGDYFKDGGSRWVMGEDLTETVAGALLRDMWDPDDFTINVPLAGISVIGFAPSPGSVITSENYYCGTGDGGGVHTNSGVPNHAFAMLVDGRPNEIDASTFNNVPVAKIGMTKAAAIYFHAETHYQTPTTNFPQHADALEASCDDLIGAELRDVTGAVSDEEITVADCKAVHDATLAVEFRNTAEMTVEQKCGYVRVLAPEASTPALCGSGLFVFPTATETWEGGAIPTGWTQTKNITGDYESPTFDYSISSELPAPHTGKALFARNDGDGTCAAGGDASGSIRMDSPEITVPDDASFLSFTHYMQSEAAYDGGNLKFSVNGSEFAIVPGAAFTYNGHSGAFGDGPLVPGVPDPVGLGGNNTSPLAGEAAWTGADQGEATGSWGTTVVDISKLTGAPKKGDKVKFRWEFGQDGCGGNLGWFIDDAQVYYCSTTAPSGSSGGGSSSGASSSGASSSGASSSGASGSGGSSSGGSSGGSDGRFGGAFGGLLLLPMFGIAALRRRRPG
ncbi:MAG: M4 family metallopeptidase [Stagnimonas sp.]|nr:M4 family metallopeptidase [Stagnimonas sp.]